jgi:hypothetical protein
MTHKKFYTCSDLLEYNKSISYVLISLMSIDVVAVFEFGGYLSSILLYPIGRGHKKIPRVNYKYSPNRTISLIFLNYKI